MTLGNDEILRALVILSVEKTLLDLGKSNYDKVIKLLYKKYHCYLPECYCHPEYLKFVLEKIFGKGAEKIAKSIVKELSGFSHHESIVRFMKVIEKK